MKISKLSAVVLILGLILALSGNLQAAAPQYNYYTTGQGNGSNAVAINDTGQAVVNFNDRAYLWTLAGGLTDLGDLGGGKSYGYAINNLGQIVGESYIDATTSHAFLWDGQIHDLGSLSVMVKCVALSINNHGSCHRVHRPRRFLLVHVHMDPSRRPPTPGRSPTQGRGRLRLDD